jgi:hypothetical protein
MCYGTTRTGAKCTQIYYLNSDGLCRHHTHQLPEIRRRRARQLQEEQRRIAIRKAHRESQATSKRNEQATALPTFTFQFGAPATAHKPSIAFAFGPVACESSLEPDESDWDDEFLAEVDKFVESYKQMAGGCAGETVEHKLNPDNILEVVDKFVDDYKQMATRCAESSCAHKAMMEQHKKNMTNLDAVLKKFDENAAAFAEFEKKIDEIIETSNALLQ